MDVALSGERVGGGGAPASAGGLALALLRSSASSKQERGDRQRRASLVEDGRSATCPRSQATPGPRQRVSSKGTRRGSQKKNEEGVVCPVRLCVFRTPFPLDEREADGRATHPRVDTATSADTSSAAERARPRRILPRADWEAMLLLLAALSLYCCCFPQSVGRSAKRERGDARARAG